MIRKSLKLVPEASYAAEVPIELIEGDTASSIRFARRSAKAIW